ncbi:MAG: PKD domain-containing protein [Bacteroidota bacterium]
MKKQLYIWFTIIFLSISSIAFSTHIVGGSLTYVYNGGSSYTITLKLYRDCSAGTAGFPNPITINVEGYNGATFTPTRDIDINLGAVSTVPPSLDPCAISPNPFPCVQQGIYTLTVNNLPPNPGGYHLTYQVVARNVSLNNVVNAGSTGASFYANIPGKSVIWAEDFALANNTVVDNGSTAWTIAAGIPAPASASVKSNLFEVTGVPLSQETWTSQIIPISSCPSVDLSVDLSESGTLDANDTIFTYYRVNGGPLIPFSSNGFIRDDFTNAIASVSGLSGNTVQVIIRIHYDLSSPTSEIYRFDNVIVSCNDFIPNSNPVFNLFPPIFICVGTPFTFNHAATDANGDSLVYSFYTPYNGDNAIGGPLDPTYPGNTASFTPIVWQPGYSATNPLGGSPLNLNSATGLLTGTAGQIGQFVVGVVVKEYRNGVYIGQTLRDFQFNVVNCPQPPPPFAGTDVIVNQGCSNQISATGYTPATVVWKSIYPGALGAYNSYLSCTTGCLSPTATGQAGAPPYVDYQICGLSAACNSASVCDTVRVTFNFTLGVSIVPQNPTLCFGQTSTTLTANGSGGSPPYTYLWNNVNPSQSIVVGNGTYTVKISDVSNCPPAYATVTVTSYSVTITANAGVDKTVCNQIPITTLNGSVTGASGGIWSGGGGTFSPNKITLSGATYSPTPAELAAGFVDLTLTTTGNGSCPAGSDIVRINYVGFSGTVTVTPTPISCFGGSNGSATVSVTGGTPPFTYSWNTVPAQTAVTATNLGLGTYSVITTNGIGCTSTSPVTITQPTPLALSPAITHVSCSGGNNGSVSVTPSGGVPPYTYLWQQGNQTTSSISTLVAGTYTVTVKDSKLCPITVNYTITQPAPIAISFTSSNVSCFNGTNGTASSTVTGGTAPYTYSWSNGASSPNATGLPAGTFTLTITDNLGCIASNSVIITQPTALIASTTKTDETCNYLNNGTATAVSSGGTSPYTYLWQPGALTATTISNLATGTYTLTVTDFKGCAQTAFAVIAQPAPLAITFVSQVNVSCFAGNNGSVAASISGGTANYTYVWAPGGATTSGISNLTAGTYSVTVTDSKGCTATNSVVITQPPIVVPSTSVTNETCSYLNNGTATAGATGGTPGYTYLWQPGAQTTVTATSLSAGTYTLTVTDSKGCAKTATAIIAQPAPIMIAFTAQTNVSCFAGSNGAVTASPSGGTAGYTYLWTPGATTTATKTNLSAGTYSVTVTDAQGCTETNWVVITQPTVAAVSTTKTDETCNYLNNGTATATASGGTPGYTYAWQPGALTTTAISNLSAGTYTVTATDSKGCITNATAIIAQPAPIAITFVSQVNVSCFAGSDGSVAASVSGGTANYTYVWAPGGATTSGISNLTAGTYSVTVTDAQGCTGTNSVVITQPTIVVPSTSVTNETCNYLNNGTATAGASGGTPGYTYLWQPGAQTTVTATGLSAGTYTLTVTDSKGCVKTTNAVIAQPAPIVISFTAQTNVSCFAGSDGSVTASPSGGTAGYTYLWTPGATTTATKTNLSAGTYSVTVTDVQGCTETNWVVITQPTVAAVSTTKTDETCNYLNNGTATASASGGTPGYTYVWQPGAFTTATISNLSAGTYTVTSTDLKGCTSSTTAVIAQPAPIAITFVSQVNVSCFAGSDGTVAASASGGTANYTYLWSPGGATTSGISNLTAGTYSVTVTDAQGCTEINSVVITQPTIVVPSTSVTNETCNYLNNGTATAGASGGTPGYTYLWQPGAQTTVTATGLSAGTYTLTVTDSKGCVKTTNAVIAQPAPIVISFSAQTNVSCFAGSDGSVTASPAGGTAGYTYLWTPGATTTATKTNLSAGTYSVTVTDAQGCTETNWVVITQPTVAAVSTTKTDETCDYLNNGTATAAASGGTPGYTYVWQPGAFTTATISNLSAGTYTVTSTDLKGCTSSTTAVIAQPAPIAITFVSQVNVSCFAGSDGSVAASVSGGTANYTYVWAPGGATTSGISNLTAGTYSVTVTDAQGCTGTNSVVITQPTIVVPSTSVNNETCNYLNNGTATAGVTGGTPGYTYLWQPGTQTTAAISGLSAGTYTLSVTDAMGCVKTTNAVITQPAPIAISFTAQTNVSCLNGNDGSVTASPSGGTPGYTYLWTPGATTNATKTNLSAGTYSITVTDAQGCTEINYAVITQPTLTTVSTTKTNETCNYLDNGTATAAASGGTPGYTYVWQPGALTTASISNLSAGTYTVTTTDLKGCTANATAIINQPAPIVVNFTPLINISCFGDNDGSVSASVSGGTANYTYLWMPGGAVTNGIANLSTGTYFVTITDTKGCTETDSIIITQPSAPLSVIASSIPADCYGASTGSLSSVANGGTGPYTYNWMPGNISGQNIPNLPAGTYTVTALDSLGCTAFNSNTITEPSQIILTTSSINSDCGDDNGQTSVSVSGGIAPYTYLWSSGGTNAIENNLFAGAYTVVVTDAAGCTAEQFGNINDNSAPSASIFDVEDVKCYGGNTGSAKVSTTGGIAPFTYLWLPGGATDSDVTGLAAGTYTVTVTGDNGCKSLATTSPDILQPDSISIYFTKTPVSCFGGSDGTATAITSGGISPYSYLWVANGTTDASITSLSATTYTIQVTDNNGCPKQEPVTIVQPIAVTASLSFTPVSCFNGADGSVSASATGGNAPYSYNWMPGNSSGPNFSNVAIGTYTVTVTDAKGCVFIDSITVTQPPVIVLVSDSVNSNCSLPNGQATIIAAGGTGTFSYQWSPTGGTNASATGLYFGNYVVTVTDANRCIAKDSVTVLDNVSPVTLVSEVTHITCNGADDGTATVTILGGIPPFTYSWSPSTSTDSTATGLAPGIYTVLVTDVNACKSIPTTSPEITEPSPVYTTISKTTVSCFGGANGTASAIASGGTPGYNYLWLPSNTTGTSVTGLSATSYTVQVTDNNSCVRLDTFIIAQPTVLSATLTTTSVGCFGGADGSVTAVAAGGTAPYNYSWMPGNSNGAISANVSSGTYTVTVTDAKGCSFIDSITVIQASKIVLVSDSVNSNCSLANGKASVVASGGTGAFSYQWAPAGGTNAAATNLLAGGYTVTVTDANGCIATDGVVVLDNASPVIAVSSSTNVTCNGASNGTATVNVSGGAAPFTYSWMPSGGTNVTATGLAPGTYTVIVNDANLCASLPAVSPLITQPNSLYTAITKTEVSCFAGSNGTASAVASGGTAGYSYLWMPGGATITSITGLATGTYSVQVTDANSCVRLDTFIITQPSPALSVALSFTPVSCFGGADGSVSAVAAGGTAPYNYNWMPGNSNGPTSANLTIGTYTVNVIDAKGCTTSGSITVTQPTAIVLVSDSVNSNCSLANGQASVVASGGTGAFSYQWAPAGGTNAAATGLLAGGYTVTVTDANGCIATDGVVVLDNASPVIAVSSSTNVTCNGASNGTATVNVSGGAAPFTYSWMPSGGTNVTATGLAPGTYTVIVNDANLCASIPAVSPPITQPNPLYTAITKTEVSCFAGSDGTASAVASGGTIGYSYLWMPGGATTTGITGLVAGTYSVQVTDANSCVRLDSFIITQPSPALSVALSFTPVSCFGGADGSVSAVAAGGTAPYNYSWMPGNSNGPISANLTIGTYTVNVIDAKGCTTSGSITVTQPTAIVLVSDSVNSNCSLANGQASVVASGGTGAFSYQWAPVGGTNAAATGLLAGGYTVTVTDANGCTANDGVVVLDNASPVIAVSSSTNVTCNGASNGTATVNVSGGAPPFTYSWMPSGGTNVTATGLAPGTYTVIVNDANLCASLPAVSPTITQPTPVYTAITKTEVSCFAGSNGTASAVASGGTAGYSYLWMPGGATTTGITGLSTGSYSVQVTDANSCIQTSTINISEPSLLTSAISSTTAVKCFGENNGAAIVAVNGGTLPYSYNWSSGGNGSQEAGLSAGTYTVNITDFNGCNTSSTVTISQPVQALSATNTVSFITCFGAANGTAGIHPSGGTAGYSYLWTPAVSVTDTAFGLSPGNYTIVISDNNSCQTNVAFSISQPTALAGTLSSFNPSCSLSNGSITSQVSGGSAPYTYLWQQGSLTTTGISGIGTGTFNLLVTDAHSCTLSLSSTLTITPDPIPAVVSKTNVSCFGGNNGSATVNITQGTAPYTLTWLPYGGNNLSASSLAIGTYTVNITDALGCQATTTTTITEPTPVNVTVDSIINVSCNGGNNGSISLNVSGGTGSNYTYAWTPSGATSAMASNLASGTYTVAVTDQNGCVKAISASVSEPAPLSTAFNSITFPSCFNGQGSASITATGGTIPYSYIWSNLETGSTAYNLIAGSYTVTVTDTNGCTISNTVLITQPSQVITSAGTNDTICVGQTGSISATATGGVGNYYYAWQPSGAITSGTMPVNPVTNTTYNVVAYDQIGCPGTLDSISVIVYTLTGANVHAIASTPICPGQSSAVYVETTGTTGPLTYQWNNNLGTGPGVYLPTPAQATTYIVTVSNVCGLSVSDSVDVTINDQPTVLLSSDPSSLCALGAAQFTDSSITGNINDPISSWSWNFGDGTSSTEQNPYHYFNESGTFNVTLTVTTDGGCTSTNSTSPLTITAYPSPVAAFSLNSHDLLIPYDILVCTNQSAGAVSYSWNFGEGITSNEVNPQHVYTLSGTFQVELIVTSQYGCLDTAYAEITTNANLIFPNVFTPNPNGSSEGSYTLFDLSNDVFFPYTYGVVEYKLEIFNRWGEEIFESLDIRHGWDGYYRGQLCQQDVYVWKAYVRLNNGKVFERNGDLTLLRGY